MGQILIILPYLMDALASFEGVCSRLSVFCMNTKLTHTNRFSTLFNSNFPSFYCHNLKLYERKRVIHAFRNETSDNSFLFLILDLSAMKEGTASTFYINCIELKLGVIW